MTCISNCLLFLDFERTQTDISSTGCSEKRDGKMRYSYCDPPEEGMALQYSCLENSMDREAWWATVHGATKSQTWLSTNTHIYIYIGFDPWVRKIPWRRNWHPTPVLLPGEPHGGRSLVGYSPWGHKESDTTERLHFTSHTHTPIYPSSYSFPFWFITEYWISMCYTVGPFCLPILYTIVASESIFKYCNWV